MWCAEGRDLGAEARVLVETMGNNQARLRAGGKRRWADRSLYTDYRHGAGIRYRWPPGGPRLKFHRPTTSRRLLTGLPSRAR